MSQIYLARFRHRPLSIAFAHWALFLPTSENDKPLEGLLFHARKEWDNTHGEQRCTIQGSANFSLEPGFRLLASPGLLDYHCLKDTNVTPAQLNDACQHVSLDRRFNLITRNCQEWVKDVIDHLVEKDIITTTVYREMELKDYKTLKEQTLDKSSSLCARCR